MILKTLVVIEVRGIKKNNAHIIIKQYKPILPTVRCFGRGPLGIVDISYLRICFLDKIHKKPKEQEYIQLK